MLRGAQHLRPDERVAAVAGADYEPELEVDLFSLMAAFRGVLERASRKPRMVIPPEQISIEDRIAQLLSRLSETEACGFEDLFADGDGSKPFLIVTFLALLEMIRLKLVRAFQAGGAGEIRIYKRARPTDAPHPIGDPGVFVNDRQRHAGSRSARRAGGRRHRRARPLRRGEGDRRGADLRVARADHAQASLPAAVGGAEGRRAGGDRMR